MTAILAMSDALVSITCLVLGILGALSVIPLGTASYVFIGVSGIITILWIVRAMLACKRVCEDFSNAGAFVGILCRSCICSRDHCGQNATH